MSIMKNKKWTAFQKSGGKNSENRKSINERGRADKMKRFCVMSCSTDRRLAYYSFSHRVMSQLWQWPKDMFYKVDRKCT